MQVRRHNSASKQKRRGFTLIELLVVISIIATLMSLILPAIQNAREAGRRTQCLNNIRNVTVAALNFASANKSRLPALSYYPFGNHDADDGTTPEQSFEGRSWVVELLPYMDQQGTYDRWDKDAEWTNTSNFNNSSLASNLYIEALACPNDESAFQTPGGLSYVANAGFGDGVTASRDNLDSSGNVAIEHHFLVEPFDWDDDATVAAPDNTEQTITKGTGVFWCEFEAGGSITTAQAQASRNSSASIGKIYDGSSNTLMFGENLNAGITNWANPDPNGCAFVLPLTAASVGDGRASATSEHSMADISNAVNATTSPFPNQQKSGPDGQRPYLNSLHPGVVVVSFCDGSASTLNESIDENVYCQLMTSDGTRIRLTSDPEYVPEDPLSSDGF